MSVTETGAGRPARDATISFEEANVLALLLLPLAAAPVVAHGLLWGGASLGRGLGDLFPWAFLPAFAASVVAHEALHAAGFLLLGRAPRRAIRFGIDRRTFSPFAGCTAPLRAGAYRAAVLLPALVLGAVPVAWGLWRGVGWATLWGAFMLLCAGGDFAVLWAMRRVPSRARVLDHPERVGCRVLGE